MARHWVYGCQLEDGTFEFDDTESGCEGVTITGCLVETGEHEGKVAITHDYDEGCSVDEYACFDEGTGKWKFEVDDGCCDEVIPGSCCGDDCDTMPKYLEVSFSDIINCNGNDCESFNGNSYILEWDADCSWELVVGVYKILVLVTSAGAGFCQYAVFIAKVPGIGFLDWCFNVEAIEGDATDCGCCDRLPQEFDNFFVLGDCVLPAAPDGYDGSVVLDIA